MPPPAIHRRFVTIAGHRTRLLEIGAGRPLLLVPSPFVLGRTYRDTMIALSHSFRVLAIELPGSAINGGLLQSWSFMESARWLIAFLESRRLEAMPIIGHSASGAVALLTALNAPKLVSHLILVGSVGADTSRSMIRLLLGRLLDAGHEHDLTLEGWPHLLHNIIAHPINALRLVKLSAREDLRSQAARITTSTLLAWGHHDHTEPPRCAREFHQRMPRSTLHINPHGSHDWLIDRPREFANTIRAFLI